MEQLKRELLLICRGRDTGRPDLQGEWVQEFFDALTLTLTEKGIESFDVEQLRTAYVCFMADVKTVSLESAREMLGLYLHVSPVRRRVGVAMPNSPKIIPIIRK